ncbi:hypothetical protein DPMN_059475 [Dreissena polymorpha]|uniref:Uncharacterized protein n=1 Tax=Dreissena polymorpha TaxID=45954 RepID=A0A9D4C420_DREPO|nr:hypothetical protein DPMN_059475 [Dreissena polymorpha]
MPNCMCRLLSRRPDIHGRPRPPKEVKSQSMLHGRAILSTMCTKMVFSSGKSSSIQFSLKKYKMMEFFSAKSMFPTP